MTRLSPLVVVATIVGVALALRLAFTFVVFPVLSGPLELGSDPEAFGQLAMNWVDGLGYTYEAGGERTTGRGPGFPLVLAATYMIFGNLYPVSLILQSLFGALTCLVVYLIARRMLGPVPSYAAAGIAALHPFLIWYSPRLRLEPLYTLMLCVGVYFAMRLRESRSGWDAVLMGLALGYASLINQFTLVLPVLFLAVYLLVDRDVRAYARLSAVSLLVMIGVIAPWTVVNYQATGMFIPVHTGGVTQFVAGNYEFEIYDQAPLQSMTLRKMGEVYMAELLGYESVEEFDQLAPSVDRRMLPHAKEYIREHPDRLLQKFMVNIPRFWYLSEGPVRSYGLLAVQAPLLLLGLIGAIAVVRRHRIGLPLVVSVLYFNLAYALIVVQARYSVPVIPFLIVLAVLGLVVILARWGPAARA